MCHVCLCLEVGVHRVAHIDELLHFLKLILNLRGFGFIQVVRIGTDVASVRNSLVWKITSSISSSRMLMPKSERISAMAYRLLSVDAIWAIPLGVKRRK